MSRVRKLRNAIDMTPEDRRVAEYAEREAYLRRVHAARKKIDARTKWAKAFQKRLLAGLEQAGRANGFAPTTLRIAHVRGRAA